MDKNDWGGISVPGVQETAPTAVRPLKDITEEIAAFQRQGEEAFLQVGRLLREAKDQLAMPGKWLEWLRDNTTFTPRTAQRLMLVADRFFDETSPVSRLGFAKACVLCRLSEEDMREFLLHPHEVSKSCQKTVAQMSKRELEQAVRKYLEKTKREQTGQPPKTRESSAASAQTVQGRIDRLRKELSALSQLVTDSKGAPALSESMTEELCKLCSDIVRQLAPDLMDELLA